jgi:hypothetical protein
MRAFNWLKNLRKGTLAPDPAKPLAVVTPLPPRPTPKKNVLTVYSTNGNMVILTHDNWVGEYPSEPWQEFIDWYNENDPEDPHYIFNYVSGCSMVKRVDIVRFHVEVS